MASWSDLDEPMPLVHRRLLAVAENYPHETAISGLGARLDYAALITRSAQLAHVLAERGAGPDRAVVVLLDKSVDLVVAAVAAWLAGGAYLPIDHRTPPARLAALLDQLGGADVLITDSAGESLAGPELGRGGPPVIRLDRERAAISARPVTPPSRRVHPGNLAYFAQTSGSTGTPKLVGVSHGALLAAYDSWVGPLGLGGRIRSHLQLAGVAFDVHVADLVRALLSGGRLVLCDGATAVEPAALYSVLHDEQVDSVLMTPTVMRLLLGWLDRTGATLHKLRQIALGGEPFIFGEATRLAVHLAPGTPILNFYGTAETCVDSAFHVVEGRHGEPDRPVPIGAGFEPTQLRVDALPGEPAELAITGPALARAYHRRPALTAERFVPDPDGEPGARIYRTGDIVVRRDGVHEFRGREDHQVKVRGVRVELGEIEAVLAGHPDVAAAVAVTGRRGGERVVVAHVVPVREVPDLSSVLRAHAAAHLPPTHLPSAFVGHEALPLTASGKVDRRALSDDGEPPHGEPHRRPDGPASADRDEPVSTVSSAVFSAWAEVLGAAPHDLSANFFADGGTSLTAARLALALSAALDRCVPVGTVFAAPTPAALTTELLTGTPALGQRQSDPVADGEWHPATADQRRMWLEAELRPDDRAYHQSVSIVLRGRLDNAALRRALDGLIAAHSALRTVFAVRADGLYRAVRPPAPVALDRADLGDDPIARARWFDDVVRAPFDMRVGPLVRTALASLRPHQHELLLVVHHIVIDGWSLRVLLDQLGAAYTAQVTGAEPPVLESEGRRETADADPAALAYWRRELADPPVPVVPRGFDMPHATGRARRDNARLDQRGTARLRLLARTHGTTPFAVLVAALAGYLHRVSGQDDIVIGAPFGDRDRPGDSRAVGLHVTTQALRLGVRGEMTFHDVVRQARRAVTGAVRGRRVPFDEVVHAIGRSGRGSSPLFRVWLNHLGAPLAAPGMAGLDTSIGDTPPAAPLFDVSLYVRDLGDELDIELVRDAAVDDATARELLGQYVGYVAALCADPDAPIGRHPLCGPSSGVLPDLTADLSSREPPTRIYPRIVDIARTRPDSPAITGSAGTLSYRELGSSVAALSDRLGELGVGPGAVVPVVTGRDPYLVVALLAVLSRGAEFAVLSADHPEDRLRTLLGALDPAVVLTVGRGPDSHPMPGAAWLRGEDVPAAGADWPPAVWRGDTPAYIAFTSGTTGEPVGVVGAEEPVSRFLAWYVDMFGIGPTDRVAMLSSPGHDPLLRDVFTPLWVGGTVCVPPTGLLRDPERSLRWLAAERVTVAHATPQLCRLLAIAPGPPAHTVRLLVVGGDILERADIDAAARFSPGAVVVNGYGATETPQLASLRRFDSSAEPTVGAGTPHTQLLVLTPFGELAGVGELGRIVVRGPYLASGYLRGRRSDPVRGGFLADSTPGHARFDTGDLGRYLPDGDVEIVGRADDQVQIDGFRVELAEVDHWVRALPDVLDCVTLAVPGSDGGHRLRCYIVPARQAGALPPDVVSVRTALRNQLPPAGLPTEVVTVPYLPLNRHGKPDRAALARLTPNRPVTRVPEIVTTVATRDLVTALSAIWCEALDVSTVDPDRNVFDMGASSMLLVRVRQVIESRLNTSIPVVTLFEYPTIRDLAHHLAVGKLSRPDTGAGRIGDALSDLRARRLAARGMRSAGIPGGTGDIAAHRITEGGAVAARGEAR